MEQKRQRAANFTTEEKLLLLNIINKYKHVLENKKTDAITWRDKESTWIKVQNEFNSISPALTERSVENLKKFYDNQKKTVRKKAAEERINLYKTGGGPGPSSSYVDPTFDVTMSILNTKSVYGLNNKFDGDRQLNSAEQESQSKSSDEYQEILDEAENLDRDTFEILYQKEDEDLQGSKTSHFQKHVNKHLNDIKRTPDFETPNKKLKLGGETAWLGRRRPATNPNVTVAKKFEDLAKAKKLIADIQLQMIKTEFENLSKKQQREEEECYLKIQQMNEIHELHKTTLQLDIELKKAQLEHLKNLA